MGVLNLVEKAVKYVTNKDNQKKFYEHTLKYQKTGCESKIRELKRQPSNPDIEIQIAELESKIAEIEMKLKELQIK